MGKSKTTNKPAQKQLTAEEALAKLAKKAAKIPAERVIPCRSDIALAAANVRTGYAAVFGAPEDPERAARIEALKKALPEIDMKAVVELLDVARALLLAAQRAAPASAPTIEDKLGVVSKHREPMLTTAEVLAKKGFLDKDVVAKIRAGSGKLDMAQDGVALADLYTRFAGDLAGRHPFTTAEITELREAGEWLVDNLTPAGARKPKSKPTEAEELRDRVWTMLVARHADLRMCGYWLHRDEIDEHVPKLLSRVRGGGEKGETPPKGETGGEGKGEGGAGNG